jgi:hypothetical protein
MNRPQRTNGQARTGDAMKDRVLFRKCRDEGDIVAVFPDTIWDARGNVASYQHVGQHGGASMQWVIDDTVPASSAEYAALAAELRAIGYDLEVAETP